MPRFLHTADWQIGRQLHSLSSKKYRAPERAWVLCPDENQLKKSHKE